LQEAVDGQVGSIFDLKYIEVIWDLDDFCLAVGCGRGQDPIPTEVVSPVALSTRAGECPRSVMKRVLIGGAPSR